MTHNHRSLLESVATLHKKHRVTERRQAFNLFSVLLRENDEANLHSKFLAALLEYRNQDDNQSSNLRDFVRQVLRITHFPHGGALIRREHYRIDILITSADERQAIVIENKIDAEDQPDQLLRYDRVLKARGFEARYHAYLTLDGHDPSYSVEGLDYRRLSYQEDIEPWLERCRKRAGSDHPLEVSIAQYLQIVRKLTRKDVEEEYVKDLVELCREGNNLVLCHDLREAMKRAQEELLVDLWERIAYTIRDSIPGLSSPAWGTPKYKEPVAPSLRSSPPDIAWVRSLAKNDLVLGFPFSESGSGLGVGASGSSTFVGVYCYQSDRERYSALTSNLAGVKASSESAWAWYRSTDGKLSLNQRDPNPESLKMLSSDQARTEYAKAIARELKTVWDELN